MERLFYGMLALAVLAPALAVAVYRTDLWGAIWRVGVCGAVVEFVAEYWYTTDYWRPPVLLTLPGPEDLVYGFGATALAVSAYPLLFRRQYDYTYKGSWRRAVECIASFFLLMEAGYLLGWHSIWVATGSFLLIGAAASLLNWLYDDELVLGPAVVTGLIVGVLAFGLYAIGLKFNPWLSGDRYLRHVYLAYHTGWGYQLLGVPADEIAWNAARGFAVVCVYAYAAKAEMVEYPKTHRELWAELRERWRQLLARWL